MQAVPEIQDVENDACSSSSSSEDADETLAQPVSDAAGVLRLALRLALDMEADTPLQMMDAALALAGDDLVSVLAARWFRELVIATHGAEVGG